MDRYFEEEKAVSSCSDGKIETTLQIISRAYIKANPENNYTARIFLLGEIERNKNYRYTADFAKIFPGAPHGSYVYAWGKYFAREEGQLKFTLFPKGPIKIWMNSAFAYGTDIAAERFDNTPVNIYLPVKKGPNDLILRFTRTKAGFGGEFGTWLGKLDYYFFRGLPRPQLSGLLIEGFDYSIPLTEPLADISPEHIAPHCLPLKEWETGELGMGVFGRIFNNAKVGDRAVAKTEIHVPVPASCRFSGTQSGNCDFYIDEVLVYSIKEPGAFQFEHELGSGCFRLSVISEYPGDGYKWDLTIEITTDNAIPPKIQNPFFSSPVLPWIYAGVFKKTPSSYLSAALDCELLEGEDGEKTWWRLDMPGAWVRLYNDNPLYGHWNYPLGVTLYGLIETARLFEQGSQSSGSAIASYACSHVKKSIRTLEYAFFDKEHFGGATAVHHLLTSLDSLDDCGSFGALVLELAKDQDIGSFAAAVDYAGEYIVNKQARREEGCFWRKEMMHHFHNETLWADDLYMSVPFLCRYAAYKKDSSILDIAALQFEGFKKYLFMEEKNLMAHVYDFKRNMNTGIPWGRGNGWTIFSLSELLMVLPVHHPRRKFLENFFNRHAAGCLACQDESGMWHQVLDMPSSYFETSCTAMFIAAFCRGIRYGWFFGDTEKYLVSAEKAWHALETNCIDRDGNIYGVCRGSEFSFNPRYYAEHLLPKLNDTHGIGIVMLAGVELFKLKHQIYPSQLPRS